MALCLSLWGALDTEVGQDKRVAKENEVQLLNGSFEEVVDEKPTGWNFRGGDGFELTIDSDQAHAGKHCACVEVTDEASRNFINLGAEF